MVIDCAKGVEERTVKLMEVCRLRDTPIMTFINKLDRDGRAADRAARRDRARAEDPHRPGDLADRHGPRAQGHLPPAGGSHLRLRGRRARPHRRATASSRVCTRPTRARCSARTRRASPRRSSWCAGRARASIRRRYRGRAPDAGVLRLGNQQFRGRGAAARVRAARAGAAGARLPRAHRRAPSEPKLTGFVFKIQANMDPGHRDRIAFLRLCSGRYRAACA